MFGIKVKGLLYLELLISFIIEFVNDSNKKDFFPIAKL